MDNKVYSFLGIAQKAGKVISGEFACERALKYEKIKLLIIAEDASGNTRKRFLDMCGSRGVDVRIFGKKELLGKYTGKDIRSVIAISDKGFAMRIIEMLDEFRAESGGEHIGKS